MEPFSLFQYTKDVLLFLLVMVFGWYIPGKYFLQKLHLSIETPERISIPIVFGIALFTLVSYYFSWFHSIILVIPVLFIITIAYFRKGRPKQSSTISHKRSLGIVIILSFLFSLPMLTSGIFKTQALYRTDDIIHLGYISELIYHFPPDNPGFSGVKLEGYHFFSDFLISSIVQLFHIRKEYLYFHFMPILTSMLFGLVTYSFLFVWRKNKNAALWGTLLVFFGGSFGFILHFTGHPEATLGSTFGIDQPASALLNPPYAISLVLIVVGLFFLYHYCLTKKIQWAIALAIIVGITPMFKIYAGILLCSAFGFLVLTDLIKKRFQILIPAVIVGILLFTTYVLFSGKGSYLIWFPLWEPHKILVDSMPWYGYEEKITTFSKFGMWHRIVYTEFYGVFLYLIGNLGTRALGIGIVFLYFLKKKARPSRFTLILFLMLLLSSLIPLFFIQSIKVFEIIQLAWYYMLIASLFASYGFELLTTIIPTKIGKLCITLLLLAMTLPSAYENVIQNVYPAKYRIKVSILENAYLETLTILNKDPSYDHTVLEIPPINTNPTHLGVLSWYRTTLPFVPAFGNKRSYFVSQNIDFPNVRSEEHTALIAKMLTLEQLDSASSSVAGMIKDTEAGLRKEHIYYLLSSFPLNNLIHSPGIKKIVTPAPFSLYELLPET